MITNFLRTISIIFALSLVRVFNAKVMPFLDSNEACFNWEFLAILSLINFRYWRYFSSTFRTSSDASLFKAFLTAFCFSFSLANFLSWSAFIAASFCLFSSSWALIAAKACFFFCSSSNWRFSSSFLFASLFACNSRSYF